MTTRSLTRGVAATIGATEMTAAAKAFPRLRTALPLLLLLLLLTAPSPPVALASEGGGNAASASGLAGAMSPVRHLPESLAASSAAGTVVAVWCDGDEEDPGGAGGGECVVILSSRSSPAASHRSNLTLTTSSAAAAAAALYPRPSSSRNESGTVRADEGASSYLIPLPDSGPITDSLQSLHPDCLLCATGLSADVVHLVRAAASASSRHAALYSTPMPVEKVAVDSVAARMGRAASSGGGEGRPFGVQCLAVGVGRRRGCGGGVGGGGRGGGRTLRVYTVDPSGGYRSWGGLGTAIGRRADAVRGNLWSIGSSSAAADSSSGEGGGGGDDDGGEEEDGGGGRTADEGDVEDAPPSPSPSPLPARPRDAAEGLEVAMAAMLMLLDDDDLAAAAEASSEADEGSASRAVAAGLFDAVAMRVPPPSSSSSPSSPFGILLAPPSSAARCSSGGSSSGTFLFHPHRVEEAYRSCLGRIVEERRSKKREREEEERGGRKRSRRRKGWRA